MAMPSCTVADASPDEVAKNSIYYLLSRNLRAGVPTPAWLAPGRRLLPVVRRPEIGFFRHFFLDKAEPSAEHFLWVTDSLGWGAPTFHPELRTRPMMVKCQRCKRELQMPQCTPGTMLMCPACKGWMQVPTSSADQWFMAWGKQKVGPFSLEQLKQQAGAGKLQPADMLLKQGTAKWIAASEIGSLFPPVSAQVPLVRQPLQNRPPSTPFLVFRPLSRPGGCHKPSDEHPIRSGGQPIQCGYLEE